MPKPIARLLALICCGALACSCTPRKLHQCRLAIAVASEANTDIRALAAAEPEPSAEDMLQAATALEAAATELDALELSDPTLQSWQQAYVPEYRRLATLTREFVAAKEQRDRATAESIRDRLQAASRSEAELVARINRYCLEADVRAQVAALDLGK